MTYVWGAIRYDGSSANNGARVGLEVSAVTSGSTVTVTWKAGFWSRWPCTDSANSWSMTGAVSKSGSNRTFATSVNSSWSTSNQILGWTSVSRSYDLDVYAGQTVSETLNVDGIAIAGDQRLTVTASYKLPANPPEAPSNVSASVPYVGTGGKLSTKVTWTNNPTSSAPYFSLYGWRWDTSRPANSYELIWDEADRGVVTWDIDDTLQPDTHYWYGISAYNFNGSKVQESSQARFGPVYTNPKAPTSITVSRSGSNLTGTIVNASRIAHSLIVETTTDDGATWQAGTSIGEAIRTIGQQVTYSLPTPSLTAAVKVRVKAVAPNGLPSAWTVSSASVVPIQKPAPPTGLTSGVVATSGTVTLSANPSGYVLPDGSSVTAYNWRHRLKGSTTWTETGKTSATKLEMVLSSYAAPAIIEHQAQGWGAHADGSDWSAVATVALSSRPLTTIIDPGAGTTLITDTLTGQATGYDPDGQQIVAAKWTITDALGRELAPALVTRTDLTRHVFPVVLADGSSVIWSVSHQKADGTWSLPATQTHTVKYVGPAEAAVTASWSEQASLLLQWTAGVDAALPEAVGVDVYQVVDGQRVQIATGLDPSGHWWFPLAPLVPTTYMLAIRSALPSTTWQTIVVEPEPGLSCGIILNGGPNYSLMCRAITNVTFDQEAGRDRTYSGGWVNTPYGRETITEQLTDARRVSFDVHDGSLIPAGEWMALHESPWPLWYRDPTGASWACTMTRPQRTFDRNGRFVRLSFTVTRIGDGESIEDALTIRTADVRFTPLIP